MRMIEEMSDEEKDQQLDYMANTIPSSWEFVDFVFQLRNVTRGFTHQFVRTRTNSYAQQTMRMLKKTNFTYRIPPRLKLPDKEIEKIRYEGCMEFIQKVYDDLIANGIEVEDARGVLPTNIHTNICVKVNLRTLSDMAKSRTGLRTQDEYREVMDLMISRAMEAHPWIEQFLFPVPLENFKLLENHLLEMKSREQITSEEFYQLNKAMDKIRKGGT
jgi:flavin-dependent thymidylate synthase